MKRKIWLLALVWAVLMSGTPVLADFYVIAGGGGVGTRINSLPYTITQPGFYYLTKNLTSTADGITVDADNVTIDLMGFTLVGPGQGSGYKFGIKVAGHKNIEIRNGTVQGFGWHGIMANTNLTYGIKVFNITALDNGSGGIFLMGAGHIVKNCFAFNNLGIGIYGESSVITENTARKNDTGIHGVDASVYNNHSSQNKNGIYLVGYCVINQNVSVDNTQNNFSGDPYGVYGLNNKM